MQHESTTQALSWLPARMGTVPSRSALAGNENIATVNVRPNAVIAAFIIVDFHTRHYTCGCNVAAKLVRIAVARGPVVGLGLARGRPRFRYLQC